MRDPSGPQDERTSRGRCIWGAGACSVQVERRPALGAALGANSWPPRLAELTVSTRW
jgi:hypothetical protein